MPDSPPSVTRADRQRAFAEANSVRLAREAAIRRFNNKENKRRKRKKPKWKKGYGKMMRGF